MLVQNYFENMAANATKTIYGNFCHTKINFQF